MEKRSSYYTDVFFSSIAIGSSVPCYSTYLHMGMFVVLVYTHSTWNTHVLPNLKDLGCTRA